MIKLKTQILEEYSRKRQKAEDDLRKRRRDVYTRIPQILDIDNEIARLSLEASKKLIDKEKSGVDSISVVNSLRKSIDSLKTKKAFLMTENSISLDYLTIKYECPECKDTGHLPNRTHCKCFRQQLSDRLYEMSNISRTMEDENFDTFDMSIFTDAKHEDYSLSPKQNILNILTLSKAFVDNFENAQKNRAAENLLFFGSTGLGKTFLCNSIAKALIDKGHTVVYQTSYKILEILQKIRFHSNRSDSNSNDAIQYELLNECDLLIIDDLGTELVNSFTNSELFNIINSRIMSNKSVIISTNFSPQELMDTYSNRISSRIFGHFEIVKFYGPDLRWEKRLRS
jgi:DNA replication protein DnaC